jgi:hypothetical protein
MAPTSDKFGSGVAGLAPLAPNRQCYPCQLGVSESVSFVVTDHAADEEVQQESFFGIGVPLEQGQFKAAAQMTPRVAQIVANELGRDKQWQDHQLVAFRALAQNYRVNESAHAGKFGPLRTTE